MTPVPTCSGPLVGDLNDDCKVNFIDMAMLAENWNKCNLQPLSACNLAGF